MEMDDAIAQMVAFTGTTPDRARQYLQVTDVDVEQAVSLYFENDGADLGGAPAATQPSTRITGSGVAQDPINLDDEDDSEAPRTTNRAQSSNAPAFEDDEAMARRLQQEMYGVAGGGEEEIRAPIARQTEVLAGPGAPDYYGGGGNLDDAIQERISAFQNRRGARRAPGIFNQQPVATSRIWQEGGSERETLAASTGGASETNERAQRLARLFAPNWDLMFQGSWDEARDEGKEEKKWLLVNIQNEKVFDCQALNRDIWKDKSVVDTIKENFLFLQYSKDDPRADSYCQYYFQQAEIEDEYPHIAIVDPRTGERVKLWKRKLPTAPDFLMQLYEFLDRYSLENSARNPVAKRKSEAKEEKPIEQLTEEEQLERALQASMAGSGENALKVPKDEDPDDLTRSVGDLKGKDVEMDDVQKVDTNGTKSAFASIPTDRPHEEPAQSPNVTRIQIRHPNGRIVRRFAINDPVQRIFEYLKAQPIDDKAGVEFELVSMGKNLMEQREQMIGEAGLQNGTVMVEFNEF